MLLSRCAHVPTCRCLDGLLPRLALVPGHLSRRISISTCPRSSAHLFRCAPVSVWTLLRTRLLPRCVPASAWALLRRAPCWCKPVTGMPLFWRASAWVRSCSGMPLSRRVPIPVRICFGVSLFRGVLTPVCICPDARRLRYGLDSDAPPAPVQACHRHAPVLACFCLGALLLWHAFISARPHSSVHLFRRIPISTRLCPGGAFASACRPRRTSAPVCFRLDVPLPRCSPVFVCPCPGTPPSRYAPSPLRAGRKGTAVKEASGMGVEAFD